MLVTAPLMSRWIAEDPGYPTHPARTTSFRSGLTEEDFNLSPEEIRELEG